MANLGTTRLNAPMLLPLVALCAGILLSSAGISIYVGVSLIFAAIILYLILLRIGKDPAKSFALNKWHYAWVSFLFIGAGIITADFQRPYAREDDSFAEYAMAIGRVVSNETTEYGNRMIVDIERMYKRDGTAEATPNFRAIVSMDYSNAKADNIVQFPAQLIRITDSKESFITGYADRMEHRGILYRAHCGQGEMIVVGHYPSIVGFAGRVRDAIEIVIEKTHLEKDTQNFLISVLLGDRAYMNPKMRAEFSDAGISHILALSGMHVAIIAAILGWLLFPLNFAGLSRTRLVIAALLLICYCFISGLAPSTIRATIMACSAALTYLMERKHSAINAMTIAVFVILLFNPYAIYDAGLQLSVVCVGSLIVFTNKLNPVGHHDHPKLYKVCAIALATLIATMSSWCLTAFYFGTVPVVFLLANIITLPLLPVYLTLAIGYICVTAIFGEPTAVSPLIDVPLHWLRGFIRLLTNNGGGSLHFTPSAITLALWIVILTCLGCIVHRKHIKFYTASVGLFIVLFVFSAIHDNNVQANSGIIVKSALGPVRMAVKDRAAETEVRFEPGSISRYEFNGYSIIAADCAFPQSESGYAEKESTDNENSGTTPATYHNDKNYTILLISRGYTGGLTDALSRVKADMVAVHPGIFKKRESALRHEADSLGIPFYSLREQGPLRLTPHPQKNH